MNPETKAWLNECHPRGRDHEEIVRCPTCEEWAPCRVRQVFQRFDILVLANGVLAPKWYDS